MTALQEKNDEFTENSSIAVETITIDAEETYPSELKNYEQWVLWKLEEPEEQLEVKEEQKLKKIPYTTSGYKASVTNPETWSSFNEVFETYKENKSMYSGIGFVFSEEDPFIGFDWDHVTDLATGEFEPEILEEVYSLNSYAEISQSGNGFHVIAIGISPGSKKKGNNREIYTSKRFFALTGNHLKGAPHIINESLEDIIDVIYNKMVQSKEPEENLTAKEVIACPYSDIDILHKCQKGKDKDRFAKLYAGDWSEYESPSDADLALCYIFANYTQERNQIDRLFIGSKLYDKKWDRSDYKHNTIVAAIEFVNKNPFKKYFVNNKFVIKLLADDLMSEYQFAAMQDNKEIFIYEDGVYQTNGRDRILQLVQQKLQNYSTPSRGNDVVKFIETANLVNRNQFNTSKTIINLKNGLYDLTEDKFKTHTPNLLSTIQLPISYNPSAQCPRIEKFLSEVVSEQDKQVLLEFVGLSMISDTRIQKAVMLIGEGANGKGVFLKLLTQFIGAENCSGESLQDLEAEKFSVAELYGKLLNVHPDLASTNLYENAMFKMLVGGDRIRGERKFQAPFSFENTARLIFSANKVPTVSKVEFAFFRRWILIQFPNRFEGKNANKSLINELTTEEELSGLLNLALEGLKRLLNKGEFSYELTAEEVEKLYTIKSDSIAAFANECIVMSVNDLEKTILYEAYVKWCKKTGEKPAANNAFSGRFGKLGYKTLRTTCGDKPYVWEGIAVKQ